MSDTVVIVGMLFTFLAGVIGEALWNNWQERRARKELRRQAQAWRKILQDIDDRNAGIVSLTIVEE